MILNQRNKYYMKLSNCVIFFTNRLSSIVAFKYSIVINYYFKNEAFLYLLVLQMYIDTISNVYRDLNIYK